MNKMHLIIAALAVIAIGAVMTVGSLPEVSSGTSVIRVGERTMNVFLAKTPSEVTKGLSGRESLDMDQGMLFYFAKPAIHIFWMPDMYFPLDIVWIRDGVVQEVATLEAPVPGLPIPTYTPHTEADRVLEVNKGVAERFGLMPGVKVVLPP